MAKTVLKMVVAIVVLAAVVFFGLQYWEKRKGSISPTEQVGTEQPAAPTTMVRQVLVTSTASGAMLQISDVTSGSYRISRIEMPVRSLILDISGAGVEVSPPMMEQPHPMIARIESKQIPAQGSMNARIRIELTQEIDFQERMTGNVLFLELSPKMAQPTPSPTMAPTTAPKPVVKKSSPKPTQRKVVAKKSPKPVIRKISTPKPVVKAKPTPAMEDPGDILAELDIPPDSPSSPPSIPEPAFTPETPPPSAAAEVAPTPDAGPSFSFEDSPPPSQPLDLDQLFPEPDATPEGEAAPKVAAVPPSTGKFDSAQVLANLPAVNGMNVNADSGQTTVRFERDDKTMFKIFRQVNPNRIVVDFKDTLNKLQSEYKGFPGTKIQRVTTQQFSGPDGTISRVTLYLDGLPKFEKTLDGNALILSIP